MLTFWIACAINPCVSSLAVHSTVISVASGALMTALDLTLQPTPVDIISLFMFEVSTGYRVEPITTVQNIDGGGLLSVAVHVKVEV